MQVSQLKKVINDAALVIKGNKFTLPVLSNIRLQIGDEEIAATAFDLSSSITSIELLESGESDHDYEADILVDADKIYHLVNKLNDKDEIELEIDNNQLKIYRGKSQYVLPCNEPDEYPSIPEDKINCEFTIDTEELIKSINLCLTAVSKDESKAILTGINLQASDLEITVAATDGHRLAFRTIAIEDNVNFNITIPHRFALFLTKLSLPDTLTIGISDVGIHINLDNLKVASRLLDGNYPNYKSLIPPKQQKQIINGDKWRESIDIIATMNLNNVVKISIDELTTLSSNVESTAVNESHQSPIGFKPIEFATNVKYLLTMLKAVNGDLTIGL